MAVCGPSSVSSGPSWGGEVVSPVAMRTRSRAAAGAGALALGLDGPLVKGGCKDDRDMDAVVVAAVKAPPVQEKQARAPVALTMVLDVSGSMGGDKLALVAKTVRFVVAQLTSHDYLGVVAYDSSVYEYLPLTRMDDEGKNRARAAANCLNAGSCTNLSGGLLAGLRQQRGLPTIVADGGEEAAAAGPMAVVGMANNNTATFDDTPRKQVQQGNPRKRKAVFAAPPPAHDVPHAAVRAVHLFTDGFANEGEVDAGKIAAEASKLVDGPHAPVAVSTFGFGTNHNEAMLQALALGGGDYYFVENEAAIARSFGEALGGLLTTCASKVVLEVSAKNARVESPLDKALATERLGPSLLRIVLDDLSAEERRDVPVRLTLPKGAADATLAARVTYQDAAGIERTVDAAPIALPRVRDESGNVPNLAVLTQVLRLDVATAMDEAEAALREGRSAAACGILDAVQRRLVESAAAHLPDVQSLLGNVAALKRHAQVDVRSAPKSMAAFKGSCRKQKGAQFLSPSKRLFANLAAASAGGPASTQPNR